MNSRLLRSKTFLALAAGVAALSLFAVACGGDDDDGGGDTTPAATSGATSAATQPSGGDSDYSELTGDVIVDGSSTVGPIGEAAAEEFGKVSDVQVSVGISGTGGGFEKFCRGETDISDASRPIKDSEAEACATGGIEYVEVKIGTDALSVVVNPDNDWIDCVTWSKLREIFDTGSTITNWNQIDPSYPDEALTIFSPGADSGTFDYFTEEINGKTDQMRNDTNIVTFSEDDNQLVQGVESETGAIGFFGYAYYQENQDALKVLQIDQDQDAKAEPIAEADRKGCIPPSEATVLDGTYSLSRPLFMYVSKDALATKPQVRGFVQFLLESPQLVSEVGYVELEAADYEAGLAAIAE